MDMNGYVVEQLVRARLSELRAARARQALLDSLRPPGRGVVREVGVVLVRLARWMAPRRAVCARDARVPLGR